MLFYRFDYLTIILFIAFCVRKAQSDLQISPEDIEYAVSRIANRQRALQFKSQPYFKKPINTNLNRKQKNLLNESENKAPQEEEQEIHDGENKGENHNNLQTFQQRQQKNYNLKNVDAAQSTTLSKQHEIEPQDVKDKKQEPQDQQDEQEEKEVEVKPIIIQNGVNQPHNQQQNHQQRTVNQTKQKQQLSQHRFKLLNVVKPRNKRQTPTVNSIYNNNNNNVVDANQQQQPTYSSITIQYYPTNQLQQNQQQQQQQQQYQQPQQYQLQYYQPSQTQTQTQNKIPNQNLQNYNNIELIVNGNSLSTFPQTTATTTNLQQYQQQQHQQQPNQIPIIITQSTNVITSTPKPVSSAIPAPVTTPSPSPSLAAPSSSFTSSSSTNGNSFKPFLPLELIKDFSGGPTTPPPPTVCNLCCTPNELPCSQCCDGNPLLNAQTLKALGG